VLKKGSYKGDRAYGAYQVMGKNIPSWTKEALGRELTPAQFLASRAAQDAVFNHRFGSYIAKTGNAQDAASMWHSGRPLKQAAAAGANDGYMATKDYVQKFTGFVSKGVSPKAKSGYSTGVPKDLMSDVQAMDGTAQSQAMAGQTQYDDAYGTQFPGMKSGQDAFRQMITALDELRAQADVTSQVGRSGGMQQQSGPRLIRTAQPLQSQTAAQPIQITPTY
jgi:hypothetical protein